MNPPNCVDALVFAQLIYCDFTDAVGEEPTPLKEAVCRMLKKTCISNMYHFMQRDDAKLLVHLYMRSRFADARLFAYESVLREETEEQFGAIAVLLPQCCLICFRGTDSSLAGWKEDFNMAFESPVPSQQRAADYVDRISALTNLPLIVTGHSKGGNLAVYGASFCSAAAQSRIERVLSFDGPGLDPRAAEAPEHLAIMDRIRVFMPRGSFVGMLLSQTDSVAYVESDGVGLMQHYSYNWQVEGMGFCGAPSPSASGAFLSGTMRGLLERLTEEQRKLFVEAAYGILKSSETDSLVTIFDDLVNRSIKMLRAFKGVDKETRSLLFEISRKFIAAAAEQAGIPDPGRLGAGKAET